MARDYSVTPQVIEWLSKNENMLFSFTQVARELGIDSSKVLRSLNHLVGKGTLDRGNSRGTYIRHSTGKPATVDKLSFDDPLLIVGQTKKGTYIARDSDGNLYTVTAM